MQIVLSDGTLSKPLMFSDNIIASIRPQGLNIYAVFEAKSGPESGGAAATQIHKWIERHLEDGIVLRLPDGRTFTYGGPEVEPGGAPGVGTVVGLGRAERHPILPTGVKMPGSRSGLGVAARVIPHSLSQTPEQINYL